MAALAVTFTLLGPGSAKADVTALTAPRPVVWKDFLGVNAHFLWFSPEQYTRQMAMLRELGLEWVRVDLHWDRHQPSKNEYRFVELDGVVEGLKASELKSVFYLVGSAPHATSAPWFSFSPDQYPPKDPALFSAFMAQLAERYPSVDAWQVWNEPNLLSFWRPFPSSSGYFQLLKKTTDDLRRVSKDKPVVTAGMAYYSQLPLGGLMLEKLGDLGILNLHTIIAYHPYSLYPEGDDVKERDFVLRSKQVNEVLRHYQVPAIWATEWGWSSYAGPQEEQPIIGPEGQADFVLRRLALMSALDYDRIFLFALSDLDERATVRDRSYGLLTLGGEPKPVYRALKNFLDIAGPQLDPDTPPDIQSAPNDLYSIAWKRADGQRLWLFWSHKGGKVKLPHIQQAALYDPLANAQPTPLSSHKGRGGIEVTATPRLHMLVW